MNQIHENSHSTIPSEVLSRAKKEIGEDDERKDATLKIIKEWLKKQPHLSCSQGNSAVLTSKRLFKKLIYLKNTVLTFFILIR